MQFSQKILQWFDKFGRKDLPWQMDIAPYRVWVSEIMLQQTQVSTALRYFDPFLKRFPNIAALANASLDDVMHAWAGLGYYARAKNMHAAAKMIMDKHQGIFPTDFNQVLALPGIGRSTAGAILTICFKKRYAILDGNVKRVLSRFFGVGDWLNDPKTVEKLWILSEENTPHKRVADYTQAIMDFGAMLCTRTKPNCDVCPLQTACEAKQSGQIENFAKTRPLLKNPKRATRLMMLVNPKNKLILLEKRPIKGIWGGLWSLPECGLRINIEKWCHQTYGLMVQTTKTWPAFRHIFTHFELNIHPLLCEIKSPIKNTIQSNTYRWYSFKEIDTLGLPAPVKKLLTTLKGSLP